MKKITKEDFKKYMFKLLQTLIIGACVGLVVGLYQLIVTNIATLSRYLYGNESILLICVVVIVSIGFAIANNFILKYFPGVDGSGIPNIELGIRGKKKIEWKFEILFMAINSFISTFAGFPLGSEGPSVVMAGKVSKMIQDVSKNEDSDQTAMACGTGFGCAFLSPVAGILYIFEESLHKFNPQLLLRTLIMMVSAYFVCGLINHHHLLSFNVVEMPNLNDYYVFFILVVINSLLGMAFAKSIEFVKRLFTKYKNNFFIKNRGYALFALVIILNITCLPLMGSGGVLINNIGTYNTIWIVILIFLFRFAITILCGSGKVTGGLVIPILTLGAISGQIVFLCCNAWFNLSMDLEPIVVLVSMCMFFGVVTKTPLTSIALIYSAILNGTGDYLHGLIILPIAAITIFMAYFISKICKVDCMYELFMEITLEDDEKNKINENNDKIENNPTK